MIINPYRYASGGGGSSAYRWYRILVTANNGNANYLAICEVEFRATHGGADLTTPAAAAGGASSASDSETGGFWNGDSHKCAFDDIVIYGGTLATRAQWLSNSTPPSVGSPKWLKYDFGAATEVTQMRMTAAHSTDSNPSTTAPKDFKVQGSNDDSAWVDLIAPAAQTGWGPGEFRDFSW